MTAVLNRTKAKAEAFAETAGHPKVYTSYDDLINDPEVDVIDALLPVENNVILVEKALAAGKPVCMEKPIADTVENARKIVALAKKSDVPVLILENWIYHNAVEVVKLEVAKIGKVVGFNYQSTGPFFAENKYLKTSWRANPKHVGGFLSDGGVHQLAYLVGVLGPVKTIAAQTTQVRAESGTDDVWFSTLKLESGAIGTFTYGSAFGAVDKSRVFAIYGDKGSVIFDFSPGKKPYIKVSLGETGENKTVNELEIEESSDNGLQAEFSNFYEAVKGQKSLKSTPEICFHHLAVVDAAVRSSRAGGEVTNVASVE